ncbi:MAG: response regulator transcription factor [Pseudomonadota bacterium]
MTRILIADDHDLVRDTISSFLEREGSYQVVVAEDFYAAEKQLIEDGPFDLVLLDYSMPGMTGLLGLEKAIEKNLGYPVAIMSGTADRAIAKDALAASAAGFVPKTMPAKSLLHAVQFMLAGEQYAPVRFMTEASKAETHPLASKLSERERQVLEGLCRGLSNKEIARELDLQEVTIKLHVKTLCRKLEARNRTQAAMIAKEEGLF